ncbi:hypothetical protein GOP47_0013308 [Adiantum capillus-veneris]|uniref:Glycolipid transfer protein domain-containing protein n=1 Tax=Adiantum capillus-veneris TaxID=13818 RepID=A0A9D4UNT3_ADICA|nr:hypothetical protein GOP47_0013308 [Adiantum capillus-veneris]
MGQTREGSERPLQQIAIAFSELATHIKSQHQLKHDEQENNVLVASFAGASSHVSVLFGCLGIAFKFAERDYVAKVHDLTKVASNIPTLQSLLEFDLERDSVKVRGSHSRNLLRVKRGLDMVRVLFQGILNSNEESLRDCASQAYAEVFAPHHSFPIRAAVTAGFYALPTRSQLMNKLNEDEISARELMQEYITAVDPVINYVEGIFLSRGLGIDW